MKNKKIISLAICLLMTACTKMSEKIPEPATAPINTSVIAATEPSTISTHDGEISIYLHEKLPENLLRRIRAVTNTFQEINGISYEQAIDFYRREVKPDEILILEEERVRAYHAFCASRCGAPAEKLDVYQLLLIRTNFSDEETLKRAELRVLNVQQAKQVIKNYHLDAVPIEATE
jgi:hypothetical protein